MRLSRALLVVVLAVAGGLTASCSLFGSGPPEPEWLSHELRYAPPRRDLLTELQWALRNAGYPPGQRDEALGKVESGWQVVLHPFSGRGRRYMGVVRIADETPARGVILEVRVAVEGNMEKKKPLERQAAKWEPMADDPARAEVLLEHILLQLRQQRSEG